MVLNPASQSANHAASDTEGRGPIVVPRKLYKIGEVMRYTGLSRQTVHNYTHQGLICEEERTPSGHRLYGEDVFARLQLLEKLKKRKKTLREIKQILDVKFERSNG